MFRLLVVSVFLLLIGACSGGSGDTDEIPPPSGAQMAVSPLTIQATVTVGTPGSLSFSVGNSGADELSFQATTSDSWISGLENLGTINLATGASRTVNLQAECPATGQLVGSISINGNDANNPSDTIDVNIECVAPPIGLQVTDAPGASNGAPGFNAQSSLTWEIDSTWPQQPPVNYTVTSNTPGVAIIDSSGTVGLADQIQNALSYTCAAAASLTASITIDAGGSQASTNWQIECFDSLEGNVSFDGAELYQGPLGAFIATDLSVTGLVDRVAGRQALLALQLGHDSATVPEFSVALVEPGQTTALTTTLNWVQTPAETGTGRWASLYTVDLNANFMQTANSLNVEMDPNNQIIETNEADNAFTIDMATLGLVQMPEFKPVFVPINAEGRIPAMIVPADYLEATLDLFPVAQTTPSVRTTYDYQGGAWSWQTALNEMGALWNAEAEIDEFYHGVYRQPPNFTGGTTGIGFVGFPAAVSSSLESPLGSDRTIAHELGHNFGLSHAPGGCNEPDPDPNYPYPFAGIGPNGGWLFSEARYIAPESGHFDVMSYCQPQFISDYNYQNVIDTFTVSLLVSGQSAVGVSSGSIALSGSVDEYGVWTMTHMLETTRPARPVQPGPFVIVLYGTDGMELYRQALNSHHTDHADFGIWAVRVPMPSGAVGAVRIWDDNGNLLLDEDLTN